jgi:hypothetical protein
VHRAVKPALLDLMLLALLVLLVGMLVEMIGY